MHVGFILSSALKKLEERTSVAQDGEHTTWFYDWSSAQAAVFHPCYYCYILSIFCSPLYLCPHPLCVLALILLRILWGSWESEMWLYGSEWICRSTKAETWPFAEMRVCGCQRALKCFLMQGPLWPFSVRDHMFFLSSLWLHLCLSLSVSLFVCLSLSLCAHERAWREGNVWRALWCLASFSSEFQNDILFSLNKRWGCSYTWTLRHGVRDVPESGVHVEKVLRAGQVREHVSWMNKAVAVILKKERLVSALIESGIWLKGVILHVSPLSAPETWIFISNMSPTDHLKTKWSWGRCPASESSPALWKWSRSAARTQRWNTHVLSFRGQVFMYLNSQGETLDVSFMCKESPSGESVQRYCMFDFILETRTGKFRKKEIFI